MVWDMMRVRDQAIERNERKKKKRRKSEIKINKTIVPFHMLGYDAIH